MPPTTTVRGVYGVPLSPSCRLSTRPNAASASKPDHLRTDVVADHDLRRAIDIVRVAIGIGDGDVIAQAVQVLRVIGVGGGIDLVAHRLTVLAVERIGSGGVAVELVAPGHVFRAITHVVGAALQLTLDGVAGVVGLEEFPLRLHLIGLLVLPVRLPVTVGIVGDQRPQLDIVGVVRRRLDDLHPARLAKLLGDWNGDHRRRDRQRPPARAVPPAGGWYAQAGAATLTGEPEYARVPPPPSTSQLYLMVVGVP